MSTYGAAAAKSQNDRAPWRCSSAEIAGGVGEDAGDVDAAEKRPDPQRRSVCSTAALELGEVDVPVGVLGDGTTSAMDSRHGSSLEWCSKGPMNTTGRSSAGCAR
jgi:hypothetical protein